MPVTPAELLPETASSSVLSPPAQTRYSAFISYSHVDQKCARWLHRSLESYKLPKALTGRNSPFGAVPRRLPPIFRDRDELPASGDLADELRVALAESRFQIVLCSPSAARSRWVNEEILAFKRLHGEKRTLALILSGEPFAGGTDECFPPALRYQLAQDGSLSNNPSEPIAADIRPGKDGRRLALLKLVAGLTGVQLAALARRDAARRQRRLALLTSISLSIAVVTIGLAFYAESQRRVAEAQTRLAEKSLDFLVSTFAIANPATENPRTITAMTILGRVSKRASAELDTEPAVRARLLLTTGDIYANLGLLKEAERDLNASLRLQAQQSEGRARTLQRLAVLSYNRGDMQASLRLVDAADRSYDHDASYAPALQARAAEIRGMIAYLRGAYGAAATLFGTAAADYRQLRGDNREELGRAYMSEAIALGQIKRFREADNLLEKSLALYITKFGVDNVLTGRALQNKALNDFDSGRYDQAQKSTERALVIYRKVYEGNHPTMGAAYILLGRIMTAKGDVPAAFSALDAARSIYVALYGKNNSAVGDIAFYKAQAAAKSGNTDLALTLLDGARNIYDISYGSDDPDQVELLTERARILAQANRPIESWRACMDAVSMRLRINPKDYAVSSARQDCIRLQTASGTP